MENVVALIVTYNRLALLQEAIAAVRKQTTPVQRCLVVNNGCTDGTALWLETQPDLTTIHIATNVGASGGFSAGIRAAAGYSLSWIWVMDDDTICENDTLEQLINKIPLIDLKVGFIGSRCNWTDGEPHLMNVPNIKPRFNKTMAFNRYDQQDLFLVESSSWVSLLINPEAVLAVGLPYKEFFFWSDDVEYTQRITKAGYLGFYCTTSTVLHKTKANYYPDFYSETLNNIWKHKNGFRNEFFLKKKSRGNSYFIFWLFAKVSYTSYKLLKLRKDHRLKFIGALTHAAWKSILFNPQIDKI